MLFREVEEKIKDHSSQLEHMEQHKATKEELNALGQLKLDGIYATVTELETAYPTGATGLYLVTSDGYTYRWNGSAWIKTVQFQSTGIADKTISFSKLTDDVNVKINNNVVVEDILQNSTLETGASNGGIVNKDEKSIISSVGTTAQGSYIKFMTPIDGHNFNNTTLLISAIVDLGTLMSNDFKFHFNLNVKTKTTIEYNKGTNVKTANIGGSMYLVSLEYTPNSNIIELHPYISITNTIVGVSERKLTVRNIFYEVKDSIYGVTSNSKMVDEKIRTAEKKMLKNIEDSTTKTVKLLDNISVDSHNTIDTTNYNKIFLQVNRVFDTSLSASIQLENGLYRRTYIKNLVTGNVTNKITTKGIYQIDVSFTNKLYIATKTSHANISLIDADILYQDYAPIMPYQQVIPQRQIINDVPSTVISTGAIVQGIRNGISYLVTGTGNTIRSSTNYGADGYPTTVTVVSEVSKIAKLILLDNGNTLILSHDGKLLLSKDNMQTWTQVKDFGTLKPNNLFGTMKYKNKVVISEYNSSKIQPTGDKVWLSEDSGETWTSIFSLTAQPDMPEGEFHVHDACYDPWEDMYWVCTGDGKGAQMIFYSKDKGSTWYKATKQGYAPTQSTQIIPLKDCVLFASDSRLTSVVRYNRPQCGTLVGSELHFDTALIIKEEWGKDNKTEVPIASHCSVDYQRNLAFFGFGLMGNAKDGITTDELKSGEIYCTDGYNFKCVYKHSSVIDNTAGVNGVYDDFVNNNKKIIARVHGLGGVVLDTTDII